MTSQLSLDRRVGGLAEIIFFSQPSRIMIFQSYDFKGLAAS